MNQIYTHHLYKISDGDNFLKSISGLEISFFSENCFSVKNAEGKYLTAFPDESIEFHAKSCSSWEKFYILDDEAYCFLQESIKNSFKDSHNLTISSYKPFLDSNRLHILMGNNVFTPSFIPPGRLVKNEHFAEYTTLGETVRASKQNPLIYFCIYGKEEYYECFYLALESLIKKGEYRGDILIKTDNISKTKNFTKQFSNKFHYSEISPELGIFNRYWLHEDYLTEYSSIIYFDADILTINNIDKLLYNLSTCDLVSYIGGEKHLANSFLFKNEVYPAHKWYGLQYIPKEKLKSNDSYFILNSGLYAINNFKLLKPVFDKIIQYKFLEDTHGDQPYFNLALYNSRAAIKTINELNELAFSRSSYQSLSNLDKTVIHYNSGVGNVSKLNLMKETWNYINKYDT